MNEGCNGICVRAYEVLPGYGSEIAIADPDCEVHGEKDEANDTKGETA